jgi:hypothetical protein
VKGENDMRTRVFVIFVFIVAFFSIAGCGVDEEGFINQEKTINVKVVSPPYIGGADYNSEKSFSVLVEVVEPSSDKDNILLCYDTYVISLLSYSNAGTILHHAMITQETVRMTGEYNFVPCVKGDKRVFKIHTVSVDGYTIDITKG